MPVRRLLPLVVTVAAMGAPACAHAATNTITTPPGGEQSVFAIAADVDGGALFVDTQADIRRLSPAGTVTRVGPAFGTMLSVAAAGDASVLGADATDHRIVRVLPSGAVTTFAGRGGSGSGGDGGLATDAQLWVPYDVDAGPDGTVVIADAFNSRVRRVSTDGKITTLASLFVPRSVAFARDGSVLVSSGGNTVSRISPEGAVTRFAGKGTQGFSGDGGAATEAELNGATGLGVAPDGSVLIADRGNHRIRRVSPQGIITTIAGRQGSGYNGDDIPAVDALLNDPIDVAATADGSVLIADRNNQRIRRVDAGLDWCDNPLAITGDDGPNALAGTAAPDIICGLGGNDTITNVGPGDVVVGGAGDDILGAGAPATGLAARPRFIGGPGNDRVTFATRTTAVTAGIGVTTNDGTIEDDVEQLSGGTAGDTLTAGPSGSVLRGGPGDDTLNGAAGSDTLRGDAGKDTLLGGDGADVLQGGAGVDSVDGQGGDDSLLADQDGVGDGYRGGADVDLVSYASYGVGVSVSLGGVADDGAPGERDGAGGDLEHVSGSPFADTITGASAANLLVGNGGGDRLDGRGGIDQLFGNTGNDTLIGVDSPVSGDSLDCGAGTDTYTVDLLDTRRSNCEAVLTSD